MHREREQTDGEPCGAQAWWGDGSRARLRVPAERPERERGRESYRCAVRDSRRAARESGVHRASGESVRSDFGLDLESGVWTWKGGICLEVERWNS